MKTNHKSYFGAAITLLLFALATPLVRANTSEPKNVACDESVSSVVHQTPILVILPETSWPVSLATEQSYVTIAAGLDAQSIARDLETPASTAEPNENSRSVYCCHIAQEAGQQRTSFYGRTPQRQSAPPIENNTYQRRYYGG